MSDLPYTREEMEGFARGSIDRLAVLDVYRVLATIKAKEEAEGYARKIHDRVDSWEVFVGPCLHGRDPYTRCDECGDLLAIEARLRKVEARGSR